MEFSVIKNLSPSSFEKLIGATLSKIGYCVKLIPLGEDIGIDILAYGDNESIGIQVKKYERRKINLAMVYHTFGATAYYNCSKAVIITLGELTPRAVEVATKLNVEIWDKEKIMQLLEEVRLEEEYSDCERESDSNDWFCKLWNSHIKDLQGREVKHLVRDTYISIVEVNNEEMTIINSNDKKRRFDIDIFRQVITKFKMEGKITREAINDEYQRRGSSAISAVLATIPGVSIDKDAIKTTLVWKE